MRDECYASERRRRATRVIYLTAEFSYGAGAETLIFVMGTSGK